MREMIYYTNRLKTPELLNWQVMNTKALLTMFLNLGTHPCAYIEVTGTGICRGNNLTKYVYEGGSIRVSSFIF